jgi:hypothetical protein
VKPLEIEWFDCDGYHRCVAGRMNPAGRPVFREFAIGMDRPPLGHVVGRQRDRRSGAATWQSPRFGSVEEAKSAVEAHLANLPAMVADAANLNRPEPMTLAA